MSSEACPFCELPDTRIVAQSEFLRVVPDHHPVCTGHTLIIPKRHVASAFELDAAEWAALRDELQRVRERLDNDLQPDGYNIGFNVGEPAGQTVAHVHLHVIPRFKGDHPSPAGGVRQVLPWTR